MMKRIFALKLTFQLYVLDTSDMAESYLSSNKPFELESLNRVMTWSSGVTVESLRVIDLQARVHVESNI